MTKAIVTTGSIENVVESTHSLRFMPNDDGGLMVQRYVAGRLPSGADSWWKTIAMFKSYTKAVIEE